MAMNGRRLRELRKAANLTQEDLAQKAGLSVSLIAKYETGAARNPTAASIRSLAEVLAPLLGSTVNQILTELTGGAGGKEG